MRSIKLHNGHSPGDVLVMTGAVRDLKEAFPDWEISVDSPCPDIWENNPHVTHHKKNKIPVVTPVADNFIKMGYTLEDVINKSQLIFQELSKESKLHAKYEKGDEKKGYYGNKGKPKDKKKDMIWNYHHVDSKLKMFYSIQKKDLNLAPEEFDVQYDAINEAGSSGIHFSNAYHLSIEKLLGVKYKQHSLLPEVHLTDEEKNWISQVEQDSGYRGKYWIINAGYKGDYTLKNWGYTNWMELVHLLKNDVQFVQVGEANPDHTHTPLPGVIDLVGKTSLRELIRLTHHSEGAVCHVSLQMHLQAAFQKPCVVIAGGRESQRWEYYPHHRYLETTGFLDCCAYDGCWLSGHKKFEEKEGKEVNKICTNMVGWDGDVKHQRQKCMAMISPEMVAGEVRNYEKR